MLQKEDLVLALTRRVEIMQRQRFKFYHYELSTPAIYKIRQIFGQTAVLKRP